MNGKHCTYTALDEVNCRAAVVGVHSLFIVGVQCGLDLVHTNSKVIYLNELKRLTFKIVSMAHLMPEDEPWHSSHELSQEDHCQKHGILNKQKENLLHKLSSDWGIYPTAPSLTSLSIHGLPRHVAKQPNSPKITMMAPVPMRTYGALVLPSEAREK